MAFKKGTSGNPKGRPPKERALTSLLENAGATKYELPDGSKVEGKKLLADMLWAASLTGKVKFADGRQTVLPSDEWFTIISWLFKQIDGDPRKELDVTSAGEPITLNIMGVIPDDDDSNTDTD